MPVWMVPLMLLLVYLVSYLIYHYFEVRTRSIHYLWFISCSTLSTIISKQVHTSKSIHYLWSISCSFLSSLFR